MIISENQFKGIITACLLLAIIPFIILFTDTFTKYKIPDQTIQCPGCVPIEIFEHGRPAGVYFISPGTRVNDFLKSAGIRHRIAEDFILEKPERLITDGDSTANQVVVAPMPQATRLSLGLPMNINEVTQEDLFLIKGIGESTAEKIILLRNGIKQFRDIDQLKEIKGIKDKRISEIRKYLYVEKH